MLMYQGQRVMKVTTNSPDGCFIMQGCVPLGNERIYGPCNAQQLSFPSPVSVSLPLYMAEAMNRLLCHLERGVLLWVAPEGVFIKRFCQGRVYWNGPMAQHADRPNKLEREKTFKLLDVPSFLNGKGVQTHFNKNRIKYFKTLFARYTHNMLKWKKISILQHKVFLCSGLQSCLQGKGSKPSYEIELCFGEEYPDPKVPKNRKLIMAQVGEKEGKCC